MKECIIVILVNILIYLCFAFMIWDLNPANWETGCRVGCAFAMVCYSLFGIAAYHINKQ